MKEIKYFTRLYGRPRKVSYAVGQGIGVLSSWSTLAFTHHVLVRLAAYMVGVRNFKDYLVLGDDIIIAGEVVAKSYLDLMTNIGIKISIIKSVVPSKRNSDSGEFASRLLVGRTDYSPLPVGLILRTDLTSQINLTTDLVKRFLTNRASMSVTCATRTLLELILDTVFGIKGSRRKEV